jgi:DNA repair protein Swi5/Sae3
LPPPPPPPPPPSISAHTAAVYSTSETITGTVSSPLSVYTATAEIPALAPFSRTVKFQSQISTIQSQLVATQAKLDDTLAKLQKPLSTNTAKFPPGLGSPQNQADTQAQAEAIVKRHIKLLRTYNEIKDVGQGLMGLIADARGVRLKEVMEEMGAEEND